MKQLLPFLALMLTACGFIPLPSAGRQTTTHDVTVNWRYVQPEDLPEHAGRALGSPLTPCEVALEPVKARYALVKVMAHEYGHCAQARYLLGNFLTPAGREAFADAYSAAYLKACGDSLTPLSWPDMNVPQCAEAPDPRTVTP